MQSSYSPRPRPTTTNINSPLDYNQYNLRTPNTQQKPINLPKSNTSQISSSKSQTINNNNNEMRQKQLQNNSKKNSQQDNYTRKGTFQPQKLNKQQNKQFQTQRKNTSNLFLNKQPNPNQLYKQQQYIFQQQQKYPLQQSHDSQPSLTQQDLANLNALSSQQYSKQQIQFRISSIQNLWQYRYTRYLQQGVYNKNWMKLFSFLGEFKQRFNSNLKAYKQLEDVDYRSNMKNQGEEGIYLIDGIVFRLAKIKKSKNNNKDKNGKINTEVDQKAIKSLHQEFLAYNILNNLSISTMKDLCFQNFKVPLTCLVKYLGYTGFCQADTPCEGLQTLIHGPTTTIYQYRQQSMPILKKIGSQLNLKQFKMLSKDGKVLTIPFSLTVQLHRVTRQLKSQTIINWINPKSILYPPNGTLVFQKPQYYLLNIRKLWPLFIDSDIMKSSGYLRPQIVLSWKTPLSNTVFSKIAYKEDPNTQLQLADACKTLKQDNIKVLAKMLDNTTIFVIDSEGIQEIMHQYGVNVRFMGELARKVTLEFSKKVLEGEMIARTCKKYFFPIFHELVESKNNKDPLNYIKEIFVDFLNLLFIRNQQGQKFYKKYVYEKIRNYYEYEITGYPPNIIGGGLLHSLAYHFGIKVKVIDYPFFQEGVDSIFNTSHITDVVGYAKTFDMQTSQVKIICKRYKNKRKQNRLSQCIPELKILATINKCLNNQKTHNIGPYKQSYFYAQLAQIFFALKDWDNAKRYAQLSLTGIPQKHADAIKPFGVLIKYHSVKKQINRCIQYYQKSLAYLAYHLSPDHPLSISVYNTLGYEFVNSVDPGKCEKIFMKSFQICQQALGYMHHTSSQILMQLAGLPLPPEKTISFLLQSLTILQNLGQHQDLIKQVCSRISQQYSKLGNIHKMIYYARKSGHWKNQIRGQDKLCNDKAVFQLCNRTANNPQQVQFLMYYSSKSHLRSLQRLPKDTLYKVFVTYKQSYTIPKPTAASSLFRRMKPDRSNINNSAEYVKNNFALIIRQIAKKLPKHHFYITNIDDWDKGLKTLIQIFIEIMSVIGVENAEEMFLAYKKTL